MDQALLNDLKDDIKKGGKTPEWYKDALHKKWDNISGVHNTDELYPLSLDEGNMLRLHMSYNPNRTSFYRFSINIHGTKEDGSPFVEVVPVEDRPHIDEAKIDAIIKQKGGNQ